ncbi:tyrosinase family protein [Pseudoduganella armeniaca]|uniref:Oxidase n=1 Tax=Pseudoduganella armeniaca TaxID=2072590 RepID=A0A2R4CC94_9BURK|nr:tyrosinase family protein [Pseudoduganella armeniaca]AVR97182.1 oxidase [Pseudoduganella armeniaca]
MSLARQDVATLGKGWNKALEHYALAMRALDALPITDSRSWKFLAAIHGFDRDQWVATGLLRPDEPISPELASDKYGNQCMHGSWYFLPWHRGYLYAFEAIVAAQVKQLTGEDWALPYWNYLDEGNPEATSIPEAFLAPTMPDGSANPLRRYPRRSAFSVLQPRPDRLSTASMTENDFIIGNGAIGFGGGVSGDFIQFDNRMGQLEANPHNTVHAQVGGYMGDPVTAGLDPLFWLHHCNVDRLWEAWMNTPGKKMVRDPRWDNGPADRTFMLPTPAGDRMTFTSKDTLRGGRLHRSYDDLAAGTGVTPLPGALMKVDMGPSAQQRVEPVGASAQPVTIAAAATTVQVDLDQQAMTKSFASMGATVPGSAVARLYLSIESVRGSAPCPVVEVYVNVPDGGTPQHAERLAGSLVLFGLNVASQPAHGGNGLSYVLDITDLAQRLTDAGEFDPQRLRVTLVPEEQVSAATPLTIDRIAVLQRSGTVS